MKMSTFLMDMMIAEFKSGHASPECIAFIMDAVQSGELKIKVKRRAN